VAWCLVNHRDNFTFTFNLSVHKFRTPHDKMNVK